MADKLIGLVLGLSEAKYREVVGSWEFVLPDAHMAPIDQIMMLRYVAFVVDGQWKSIATIGAWHVKLGEGIHTAEISQISEKTQDLVSEIRNPKGTMWLNNYQLGAVESAMKGKDVAVRPESVPPCLDFEQAAAALASYYGVNSPQVEISIKRGIHHNSE